MLNFLQSDWMMLPLQAILGFMATLGFAILYNVPRRALWACALIGMGGHLLRQALQRMDVPDDIATFVGALFVGIVGVIPAKRLQLPLILFAIAGIVPLIPGIPAYKVIVYFRQQDILGGLSSAIEAVFRVGAIATGIGTARILTDREWWFERE